MASYTCSARSEKLQTDFLFHKPHVLPFPKKTPEQAARWTCECKMAQGPRVRSGLQMELGIILAHGLEGFSRVEIHYAALPAKGKHPPCK